MPFYEYECPNCKFYTEVMQKISDAPLKKCPSCGKRTMKKLVSAPVFRLKGSGWYETDFKSDKEGKRNLADGARGAEARRGGVEVGDQDARDRRERGEAVGGQGAQRYGTGDDVYRRLSIRRQPRASVRPLQRPSARPSGSRGKAKPAARAKAAKRGSRR